MRSIIVLTILFLVSCGKESSSHKKVQIDIPKPETSPTTPSRRSEEVVCERSFRVLPLVQHQSFIAVENFGAGGVGRCRGTVIWAQKLALLTRFSPNEPHRCHSLVWNDSNSCAYWLDRIFEKLSQDKVAYIAGFRSVYDFTSHPEVAQRLRGYIASVPSRYSAFTMEFEHGQKTQMGNTFKEALRRVRLRYVPYLAVRGTRYLSDHALMAYKIVESTKPFELKLCIKDPNYVYSYENCRNYLLYNTETEDVFYVNQHGENEYLSVLELMSDENDRINKYIHANYSYCQKK